MAKPSVPVPLEKEIQKQILQYLAVVGIVAWRVNSGGMIGTYKGKDRFLRFNSMAGHSDICGLIPPRLCDPPLRHAAFLAVEVKRPGGKLSQNQVGFLEMIQQNGGLALVATSVEDLREKLKLEGYQL